MFSKGFYYYPKLKEYRLYEKNCDFENCDFIFYVFLLKIGFQSIWGFRLRKKSLLYLFRHNSLGPVHRHSVHLISHRPRMTHVRMEKPLFTYCLWGCPKACQSPCRSFSSYSVRFVPSSALILFLLLVDEYTSRALVLKSLNDFIEHTHSSNFLPHSL